MMTRLVTAIAMVAGLASVALAQAPPTTNMEILRQKIKADKKLLRLLTGHTYGYDDGRIASEALDNAIKATEEWFEAYLTSRSTREA